MLYTVNRYRVNMHIQFCLYFSSISGRCDWMLPKASFFFNCSTIRSCKILLNLIIVNCEYDTFSSAYSLRFDLHILHISRILSTVMRYSRSILGTNNYNLYTLMFRRQMSVAYWASQGFTLHLSTWGSGLSSPWHLLSATICCCWLCSLTHTVVNVW